MLYLINIKVKYPSQLIDLKSLLYGYEDFFASNRNQKPISNVKSSHLNA